MVVSDIHLGTYGCRAKELLRYLKSVDPATLILNGDIIDGWQFNKRYFPSAHLRIIKYLLGQVVKGKKIIYITGNHDDFLRRFRGFKLANFEIVNKKVLELGGQKAWFFHGDVFDVTMKHSRWLAKLGGMGYDLLIQLNNFVNWISFRLGRGRISLSKRIKNSVKQAIKYVNDFEETAARIAIANGYDFVVCGHIHQPQFRTITDETGGTVTYLNSGDWIENLTALEYNEGQWNIHEYREEAITETEEPDVIEFSQEMLFTALIQEFEIVATSL